MSIHLQEPSLPPCDMQMNRQMCSEEQDSNLPLMPNRSTRISRLKFCVGVNLVLHGMVPQTRIMRIDTNGLNKQSMLFTRSMASNWIISESLKMKEHKIMAKMNWNG